MLRILSLMQHTTYYLLFRNTPESSEHKIDLKINIDFGYEEKE